jgi:hypothetical protein
MTSFIVSSESGRGYEAQKMMSSNVRTILSLSIHPDSALTTKVVPAALSRKQTRVMSSK